MLRADIEDRQEGGFSERNRKVGPNDAEVPNLPIHPCFEFCKDLNGCFAIEFDYVMRYDSKSAFRLPYKIAK